MKKVLIITYYWPPSGGGGVQRWLKFVKYLPKYGWTPVIYTPDNPDFELQDPSLCNDVEDDIEVIKRPIWEPFGLYRKLLGKKAIRKQGVVDHGNNSWLNSAALWIRGNVFVPDPRVFWVRPSVGFLDGYIKQNSIDVIVTTGPPHSMHLIGLELKKRNEVKWLADFRDPWSKWDVLAQLKMSSRSWKRHSQMESTVIQSADHILTTSKRLKEQFISLDGGEKVSVITNGYDEDDFNAFQYLPLKSFQITHIGLLNTGRNPKQLWESLNELCDELDGFKEDLVVYLAGTIEEAVINNIKGLDNLADCVEFSDYINHQDVIEEYAKSSILLLLMNQTETGSWIIPGKVFEYIRTKKSIFGLGQEDSAANELLTSTGFDAFLSYDDKQGIKDRVLVAYKNFKGNTTSEIKVNVEQFSREGLTIELSELLDQLCS